MIVSFSFLGITKIKTIGSTYMCASGMTSGVRNDLQTASHKERWQHLADLVEFALALNETLNRINEQSFNHFMLRIG